MKNSKYRLDIIPGTVIFIFSIWYLLNIPGIPTFTGLGATPLTNHFVPYLWGGAMLVLSLWLIVRGMKKRKAYKAEGGVTQKNSMIAALVEKREVVVSFVALGLYVGPLGLYLLQSCMYLYRSWCLLRANIGKRMCCPQRLQLLLQAVSCSISSDTC